MLFSATKFIIITPFYPALVRLIITTALLSLSCGSYIIFWALIELNIIRFLGVLMLNFFKSNKGEGIVYLIVQGVSSIFILRALIMVPHLRSRVSNLIIFFFILVKLGAAPVHFWYFWIIENLSWDMFFYVSSIQKLLPLVFLGFFTNSSLIYVIYLTAGVGAVGAILSKKIMYIIGYSSLLILGWLMPLSNSLLVMLFVYFTYTANLIVVRILFEEINWENLSVINVKFWNYVQGINLSVGLFRFIGVPLTLGFMGKFYGLIVILRLRLNMRIFLLIISGVILWIYSRILFNRWKQFSLGGILTLRGRQFPWVLIILAPTLFLF